MSALFNGTWRIDVGASTVWDDAAGRHVADEVGDEVITMRIEDGVQDYEVLYGENPTVRMGYRSRYDDPEWVPYLVRGITGQADHSDDESLAAFKRRIKASGGERERRFEVGRAYGLVRTILVDDRTHYRVRCCPKASRPRRCWRRCATAMPGAGWNWRRWRAACDRLHR